MHAEVFKYQPIKDYRGKKTHDGASSPYNRKRKKLKDEIRRSEHRERSYIAHRDTLRQLLNDPSIFINRIQYENSERLIDYTDSTDIIKAAHFRKDGSIRITDSPEVVTLHDARTEKKVRWKTIK